MLSAPLAQRLRDAADAIEELSTLIGYPHPSWPEWSAVELRREATVLEADDA